MACPNQCLDDAAAPKGRACRARGGELNVVCLLDRPWSKSRRRTQGKRCSRAKGWWCAFVGQAKRKKQTDERARGKKKRADLKAAVTKRDAQARLRADAENFA